jgi:2,4-dienoyl-CoA reductase-like NADH-dependent reductase (Old Yellow Enzyme family)
MYLTYLHFAPLECILTWYILAESELLLRGEAPSNRQIPMLSHNVEVPTGSSRADTLFQPVKVGILELANRIVMAPMTRAMSPAGIPTEDVARYYRRRAEGGTGLIITEGTFILHPGSDHDRNAPRFYGEDALAGWKRVADQVHQTACKIFPQLWHVGLIRKPVVVGTQPVFDAGIEDPTVVSPSGIIGGNGLPLEKVGNPATHEEILEVIEAYGLAAATAKRLGFDGIEVHGAHGYLIDQFLWEKTNLRDDEFGGSISRRSRFAVEVIREIRRQVGPEFPLVLRLSTWKQQDFSARLATTPDEWSGIVGPLAGAGVDAFHISQRRYWEGEFGSELNLAA